MTRTNREPGLWNELRRFPTKVCNTDVGYASGHWYESSGFWSPASAVIATLVIGALGLWVAWRGGFLKGRLYYSVPSDTSLLPAKSIKGVEVRYGDMPLVAPRAVTVVLRNGRWRDIAREAFDGTSFQLDLREQIIECLHVSTTPPNQPQPHVTTEGSVLSMEPVKISGRESISVELLIDGESPEPLDPVQMLTDVEIRQDPGARAAWLGRPGWLFTICILLIFLAATFGRYGGALLLPLVAGFVLWQLVVRVRRKGGRVPTEVTGRHPTSRRTS